MKGNAKVITTLNGLLADELTAINQYIVHKGMAENWGYGKLAAYIGARMAAEQEHANELIERILFLEGVPVTSKLNAITIGADALKGLFADLESELVAVDNYRKGIETACEAKDFTTRALLEHILGEEEAHVNGIEERTDQIEQMGVENWLSTQVG